MDTIELKVSTSPDGVDAPEAYTLTFSAKDRKRIQRIFQLIQEKLFDRAEFTYYAEPVGEAIDEWVPESCTLNISEYGITYSEYHKHNLMSMVETETFKPDWLIADHEEEE